MSWAGVHFGRSSPPMPRHEGGIAIVVLVVLAFGINYSLAEFCEISFPCNNGGTCTNIFASPGFQCECPPGFELPTCGERGPECTPSPCLNSGTCVDFVDDFRCSCVMGFTGTLCEIEIVSCLSDPCQNGGTCLEPTSGSHMCSCSAGFTGTDCELVAVDASRSSEDSQSNSNSDSSDGTVGQSQSFSMSDSR